MKIRSESSFTSIRTEGALLPSDLIRRVAAGDRDLGGLAPSAYHLDNGETLNEAINRSWSRLRGTWATFQGARAKVLPGDAGTTLTRERWLLPLFQELGYGRLQSAKPVEIEGKSYRVSHRWENVPIHLVSFRADLDKREIGLTGASHMRPNGLVQELLNRSGELLWGMVANGLRLRILRDNVSLSRQAYLEFDLESMMDGELYADFAVLWLFGHQSRVEGTPPEACWLEIWSSAAKDQGTRALGNLRRGVADAIQVLGSGFLSPAVNGELRGRLIAGELSAQDYYRELLRLVYRLLFLFVAEDRGALHDPQAPPSAKALYASYYSTARLRRLAARQRGSTRHNDLYRVLQLVFAKLGSDAGSPELGLPALGSFLFSAAALPDLDSCVIANRDLLEALRALAFTGDGNIRRAVDYRNLGPEELGSVYEALLELHPQINLDPAQFELSTATGHERKISGSYYTPTSLTDCLLNSALGPLLDEAAQQKDPGRAILDLKVCDPACGSGHFLIAAGHRIARRLASIGVEGEEPSPDSTRQALRAVIGRCLYGVDKNPMAAELCKINLWLEALDPGRPLSFLDHHIQVGNSLLGVTPALLAQGIPDAAFTWIEGDDRTVCRKYKKLNQQERRDRESGQEPLAYAPWARIGALATSLAALEVMPDATVGEVHAKEHRYAALVASADYDTGRFLADAWCASFVWPKVDEAGHPSPITEDVFRAIERNPQLESARRVRREVQRLAGEYHFFHWHLAFPGVFRLPGAGEMPADGHCGWSGGFDLVLGNPPWDTLSPDQREFFGAWVDGLRSMAPPAQQAEIERLLSDPPIAEEWSAHCRGLYALVHFLKHSGVYTLYAPGNLGKGDFNTYRMFVELALRRLQDGGYAALVVPGGLYGGANASALRHHLLDQCRLHWLFGLINTQRGWFKDVDIDRFAAFAAQRGGRTEVISAKFGLRSAADLSRQAVEIDADWIRRGAPQTYAIPDLRGPGELAISEKMAAACPAFGDPSAGPPPRHYQRELDMGNDRGLFTTDPEGLPVYEGRMIDQYDHRAKTYESGHGNSAVWVEREFGDPAKAILPQWRVLRETIPAKLGDRCDRFRIGFGDVANPRNERSFVATIIPPKVICGHKVPTLDFGPGDEWFFLPWLAVANSFSMDWVARTRLTAPMMAFSLLDSLPFPRLPKDHPLVKRVSQLVLRLVCTSTEMTPFWNRMASLGYVEPVADGTVPPTSYVWPDDRTLARAELDAIVASEVFALTRQELSEILDTFPVVCKRDLRKYGDYRTKLTILEIFDAFGRAKAAGLSYQSPLDRSTADPSPASRSGVALRGNS